LSSTNPLICAFAMMPSRRDAAKTKPTKPAPMTKPATSFAGGSALVVTAVRPRRPGGTRATRGRAHGGETRSACMAQRRVGFYLVRFLSRARNLAARETVF
jgi:hypothetical protein